MLAARDQENRLFSHQGGAASKQQGLQPKTPGARYPKTPLKVPLNDENATRGLGAKSGLKQRTNGGNENLRTVGRGGKAADRSAIVTPGEPTTTRAPLGNKTTNAKARGGQTVGVKQIVREIEQTKTQPNTTRRPPVRSPQAGSSKLEVHNDDEGPLRDDDIEYIPPPVKEEAYQSDVFPAGVLSFDALKPENRMKGYYNHYFNPVDENGVPLREKRFAEEQQKAFDNLDEQIRKDLDEADWSIEDVPGTKDFFKKRQTKAPAVTAESASRGPSRLGTKPPATLAARKAASALSIPPKSSTALQPKVAKPVNAKARSFLLPSKAKGPEPTLKESTTGAVASRTTIGYNKGRAASSMVHSRSSSNNTAARTFTRTASTMSSGSDTTITPSRYAQKQAQKKGDEEDWRRLEFLSIFDVDENDEGGLDGTTDSLFDDLDDDFQLEAKF